MTKKILLLGANERACFSVAKNLHRHKYHVDVVHWGYFPIIHSRFIHAFHILPELESDVSSFFEEFCLLLSKHSYWLVLPVNDMAVEFLNRYKNELGKYAIIGGINSPEIIRFSQNKHELWKACKQLGINVPETKLATTLEDFDRLKAGLRYPVIAKPASSRKLIGNRIYSFSVRKFSNEEALTDFVKERILSIPVMLQEVVNGFGIGFNFLAQNGQLIAYYMHERINEPVGGGESSYRKTLVEDKYGIVEKSRQLISHINWNGVGMIEYKVNEGKAYIMELNGRFWGSIELGIFAGIEIPYWQVLYNYENHPLPGEIISCRKVVYARNFRNELLVCLKERSVKNLLRLGYSIPKMFRVNEKIEDSLFTDAKFRLAMWVAPAIEFLRNRGLAIKRKFISGKKPGPVFKELGKVLFICEGNICRSSFAENYLRKIKPGVFAASCGFQYQSGKMSPSIAVKVATQEGIDLSKHRSVYIGDVKIDEFDALFVMDKKNYQKLASNYPKMMYKAYFLGVDDIIPDPYGGSESDFKNCYTRIRQILDQNFGQ
jgi:protein-tyrosine-phosphatase/predicted ATP-grasp superfamily ATP-dependent carboligase